MKQLKGSTNSDMQQSYEYRETVCTVSADGDAKKRKKDTAAYIIFSLLSLGCCVLGVMSLEMVNSLRLLCMIPAGLGIVFAILGKKKKSGVLSIMALVFSIICAVTVCSISLACVCVREAASEVSNEYVEPYVEKFEKWASKFGFLEKFFGSEK